MNTKLVGYFALIIGLILAVHMLALAVIIVNRTEVLAWPDYVQVGLRLLASAAGGLLAWRGWRRVRLAKAQNLARDAARQMLENRRQELRGRDDSPNPQRD